MTAESDAKTEPTEKPLVAAEIQRRLLKLVLELGPIIIFFILTNLKDLYVATAVFVPMTILALATSWLVFKRVARMPLISAVYVVVFGGLTLYLHNDLFMKIKPTFYDGMISAILFAGLASGRSWLKYLFEEEIHLTDEGWRILTFRWACFFALLAVLNEIVWRNTSQGFWAGFKLYGVLPLTVAFTLAQIGVLKKHESAPH